MKGQRIAAFGSPRPRGSLTGKGHLLKAKARLLLITAPVRRWHSKQWHIAMREGSPSIVS
jgi:hypothetical protein